MHSDLGVYRGQYVIVAVPVSAASPHAQEHHTCSHSLAAAILSLLHPSPPLQAASSTVLRFQPCVTSSPNACPWAA